MNPEKLERKKILVEIFDELPLGADTSSMIERANAILTEAGQRDEYKKSVAIWYASDAFEILNSPEYEAKKGEQVDGYGTLEQYCRYLLERARDNYTNETAEEHSDTFEKAKELIG